MKKIILLSSILLSFNAKAEAYFGIDFFTETNSDYNEVNLKLIENEYINFTFGIRNKEAGVEFFKTFNFPHGVIASHRSNVWLDTIDKSGILFNKYWYNKEYDLEYSISFGVANITRTLSHDIKADIVDSYSSNVVGFGVSKDLSQDTTVGFQIKLFDGYENMSEYSLGFKFYF